MKPTPFFPAWRASLAPLGLRTAQTLKKVRALTLCRLESSLGTWMPADVFPKATCKQNSRDRIYTRSRTFWCMLWQSLNPNASGREVVRQLQALFGLEQGPNISQEDGAYCRAKARLNMSEFPKALGAVAKSADRLCPSLPLLQGRPLKAVDGSTATLADTRANRTAYPPPPCNSSAPCFPVMRVAVIFSMLSGAILAAAQASLHVSELGLMHSLATQLTAQDIVVGDRGFGSFPFIAWLRYALQVDFIGRTTHNIDGRRRLKRLGRSDWLVYFKRAYTPSPWLSALEWAGLPQSMTLRAIKGSCRKKGFRVRQVTVVTTLLDPKLYPAQQIMDAYLRRWRLEMCLDDLKTTLQMEMLRGRTPEMVQKEFYAHLIAHNLLRCVMGQAASEQKVSLERISFKGSLDALRHTSQAMAQARSRKKRQELWDQLLQTLAADLVPLRPDRREPRAVKRKKTKYPRLRSPRHIIKDRLKRHTRRSIARLRKLGLM